MIVKVSLGFAKLNDGPLLSKAGYISEAMTGNPNFPTPLPPMLDVSTAVAAYESALFAAEAGGKEKTAAKHAARKALLDILRLLALYVQQKCDGDMTKLLSSGFDAVKQPEPAGVLPAPQNVTLKQGTLSGTLVLRGRPVPNAASYEAQQSTNIAQESAWQDLEAFTAVRTTLNGLTPGTQYWARIRAVGAAGPGAWSEPVLAMAL
jgi:hypothetical protein